MFTRAKNLLHNLAVFSTMPINLQRAPDGKTPAQAPAGPPQGPPPMVQPPPAAPMTPGPVPGPVPVEAPTPPLTVLPSTAPLAVQPRLSLSAASTLEHLISAWMEGNGEVAVEGVRTVVSDADKRLLPALVRFIASWRETQGRGATVQPGTSLEEAMAIAQARDKRPCGGGCACVQAPAAECDCK